MIRLLHWLLRRRSIGSCGALACCLLPCAACLPMSMSYRYGSPHKPVHPLCIGSGAQTLSFEALSACIIEMVVAVVVLCS